MIKTKIFVGSVSSLDEIINVFFRDKQVEIISFKQDIVPDKYSVHLVITFVYVELS